MAPTSGGSRGTRLSSASESNQPECKDGLILESVLRVESVNDKKVTFFLVRKLKNVEYEVLGMIKVVSALNRYKNIFFIRVTEKFYTMYIRK